MYRSVLVLCLLLISSPVFGQSPTGGTMVEPMAFPPFFSIPVPSGASLISSPVDAGTGPAGKAFLGLPADWPLFFAWNAGTQTWVDGRNARLRMGDAYWLYTPTPAALTVAGTPYRSLEAFQRRISPGWHLLGVPFTEGYEWNDVRLFVSGNPIGLETAFDLGWIDSSIFTMRGSVMEAHTRKDRFDPGRGYWFHVNTPLTLRAERSSAAAPALFSFRRPVTPGLNGASTAQAIGWVVVASESVASLTELGGALKAGEKIGSASINFLGATFGLAKFGLETSTNEILGKLNEMDAKLDQLIVTVDAMEEQLSFVENEIQGLQNFIDAEERLGQPVRNAEDWLTSYYTDQTLFLQSRNWARYQLAGCDTRSSICDPNENPITQASYDAFNQLYAKNPGKLDSSTDDFYLWWSYSVAGGKSGVSPFISDGLTADGHYQKIQTGLTADAGADTNGLVAYMRYVFSKSPCALDVSPDTCDLYAQVYIPLEAYFQKAIGDQIELAEAIVEARATIAQTDPSYQNSVDTYMTGVRRNLGEAAEAFLQAVEAMALYRAADGLSDWNTFGATDAGQALARADFAVQQLTGQDYMNPLPAGYTNPPWPAQGVVGRIFYTVNEPAATASRTVCAAWDSTCAPVAQLSDVQSDARTVQGGWPYLQYGVVSGTVTVEATPALTWHVKRLAPATIAPGSYNVTSSNSIRGNASLVVSTYDRAYNNPPSDTNPSNLVTFASLNSVEGPVGQYGLNHAVLRVWQRTGGDNDTYHDWGVTKTAQGIAVDVSYTGASSGGDKDGFWSSQADFFFNKDSDLWSAWPKVKFSWPVSDVDWQMDYGIYSASGGSGCTCCVFNSVQLKLEVLDDNGNPVTPRQQNTPVCDGGSSEKSKFNECSFTCKGEDCNWSLGSASLLLKQGSGSTFTFKTSFRDAIKPYVYAGASCNYNYAPLGYANTHVKYPMITMTK